MYVLKECPPAQSIAVVDKGYLFVWDPSESVPYLVAPQDIKRCRLKIPRSADDASSLSCQQRCEGGCRSRAKPCVSEQHAASPSHFFRGKSLEDHK